MGASSESRESFTNRLFRIPTRTEKVEHIVNQIKSEEIKHFILSRLNKKVNDVDTDFFEVFFKEESSKKTDIPFLIQAKYASFCPIALFAASAAQKDSDELISLCVKLEDSELISLLGAGSPDCKFRVETLLKYLSDSAKMRLIARLNELNNEQVNQIIYVKRDSLFGDYRDQKYDYNLYKSFFNTNDEMLLQDSILLFSKLRDEIKYYLFQTGLFSEFGLIKLLARPLSNQSALALLKSLASMDKKLLLKLFKGGEEPYSYTSETMMNAVILNYSKEVVEQAFTLLVQLDTSFVNKALTYQAKGYYASYGKHHRSTKSFRLKARRNSTFVGGESIPDGLKESTNVITHLAMSRTDCPAIGMSLIQTLSLKPELKSLITKKAYDSSVLELAVQHNNLQALNWFFGQADYHLQLSEKKRVKLLAFAKKCHNEEAQSIIASAPVYQALTYPIQTSKNSFDYIEEIKKNPEIVNSRWSQDRTLLHIAAARGNLKAVIALIESGANINALDKEGLTPWQHAIFFNHTDTATALLKNSNIQLNLTNVNDETVLTQVLKQHDYVLTRAVISQLESSLASINKIDILTSTLEKLPFRTVPFQQIETLLEDIDSSKSLKVCMSDYCDNQKDERSLFLTQVANYFSTLNNSRLALSCENYLQAQLKALTEADNGMNQTWLRQELILFLFAMSTEKIIQLINAVKLSKDEKAQLELVLCQGLVKPAVYTRLNDNEQKNIVAFFEPNSPALETLISIHFRQSDLTQIPLIFLKDLVTRLPIEKLITYSKSRLHPLLIVLTLNQIYLNTPDDIEALSELQTALEKELDLLNKPAHENILSQLTGLCNLIDTPMTKAFFMNYLSTQPHDAPIYRNLAILFEEFTPNKLLNQNSLLYSLFLESCLQENFERNEAYFKGMGAFLQVAKKEDVEQVLKSTHNKLLSSIQTERLLASASTGDNQNPTNHAMPRWLFGLHAANARIELTDVINSLYANVELCDNTLEELGDNKAFDDHLKPFKIALVEFADKLMEQQFSTDYPLITSSLKEKQQKIAYIYPLFKEIFEQNQERLAETNLLAMQQLNQLLEQCEPKKISMLVNDAFLKSSTQQESNSQLLSQSTALLSKHQKEIKEVFSSQEVTLDEKKLDELGRSYHRKLEVYTHKLTECLKSTIDLREDANALLPDFYHWQMSNGNFSFPNRLFKSIPTSLNMLSNDALDKIQQDIKERHKLIKLNTVLVAKLKRLSYQQLSLNELIEILCKESLSDIQNLKALCNESQCSDLSLLVGYIIKGKSANWDSDTLQDLFANFEITHINQWLSQCHENLANYSATITSMKVLFASSYKKDADNLPRLESLVKSLSKTQISQSFTIQAFKVLINTYKDIVITDMYSPLSQQFIFALYLLLDKTSINQQSTFVNAIPMDLLEKIITYCLSSIGADEESRIIACKGVLSKICHHAKEGKEKRLSVIKKHLGQQDLNLLGGRDLQEIALSVLNEKDNLSESVYDGVWIQRLLCSPRFIAHCSSADITNLVERYKALSLTLKQDEFEQLNHFIAGKLTFKKEHSKGMLNLQQEILANPAQKERLIAKRERLLHFRASDSIRALFTQLEDNCIALKKTYPEAGEQALKVLYSYHSEQLKGMRSDLLFKMANFLIQKGQAKKGDIAKANSSLSQWMEKHLPHHNFHQSELENKADLYLYDEKGQKVGYLDESNYAMGFVQDYPVSLLEKGYQPHTPFYDKNRCRIGTLLENGQCKRDNLFQKTTSALLIAKVPVEHLLQSEAALDLLLQDVLCENTLELLYMNSTDAQKLEWIKDKITQRVQASEQIISKESIERLVVHNDFESVMTMIANCSNNNNAQRLFKAVLSNQSMRKKLLEGEHQELFFAFLSKQKANKIFAEFLVENTLKPWLNQGLQLFANYSVQSKDKHLLSNSLAEIVKKGDNKEVSLARYDMVMSALIRSKEAAKIVLNGFVQDNGDGTVQSKCSSEMRKVAKFFEKTHLTEAVSCLNDCINWHKNPQYRLLLGILQTEQSRLFPRTELRLSERDAWQSQELDELTTFVTRHLESKHKQDRDNEIGQRLLSEIVFRCANFGIIKLFYTNDNQLNPKMAGDSIKRSFIESISSRLYLVKEAKQAIKSACGSVKDWFNSEPSEKKALIQELKDNYAIIDWKSLAKTTWSHTKNTEMPLVIAYLMNYAGPTEPLATLLRDIMMHPQFSNNPHYLEHISYVMAKYYHRDVSRVIFSVFESIAAQNPSIITSSVLSHMALFHALANSPSKISRGIKHDEIELLRHFGQQKQYTLTHHCCKILSKKYGSKETEKQVKRASTEAKVEKALQKNVGKWFFGMSQLFKRWWNYGNKGRKKPTGIVKFCDDDKAYSSPVSSPELIKTHVLGGQYVSKQIDLSKRRKLLKEQFDSLMVARNKKKEQDKPTHQIADLKELCLFGEEKGDCIASIPSSFQACAVN